LNKYLIGKLVDTLERQQDLKQIQRTRKTWQEKQLMGEKKVSWRMILKARVRQKKAVIRMQQKRTK
jgi:hypothetical protein